MGGGGGGGSGNLLSSSGKALTKLFFLLPQLSRCQEMIHVCTTFELKSGILTLRVNNVILCLYSLCFYFLTFEIGRIIYEGLLLLTPKFLSLLFDSQDNIFLSWAHSYATFHSLINESVEDSHPHQWTASHGGCLHFKERTSLSLQLPSQTKITCDASF